MFAYQHILLALDYSEHSEEVAQKAVALAKQHHARLSIVHVLDNIAMPDTEYGTVLSLLETSDYPQLEAEKDKLNEAAARLGVDKQHCRLIWGNPKQEIVELADKQQVDLIVVGSHGRHGLALLLGSTANAVLHHAHCDVMAVRMTDD
jgi:universal stress protein A